MAVRTLCRAASIFSALTLSTSANVDVAPFSLMSSGVAFEDKASAELSVSEMEKVFTRTEVTHQDSMSKIAKGLSVPKAMELIKQSSSSDSEAAQLDQVYGMIAAGKLGKTSLRATDTVQKKKPGYSGIEGARNLLNDMIFESLSKYDAEIAKCTAFYAQQCALMEIARGAIAAANFVAANSRALILDAQGNINKCEVAIPTTKLELKDHNTKCRNELEKLNARLKIVMGDIAVMTMILKMTDCEKKLLQMKKMVMLRCQDQCTKRHTVSFNHESLQKSVSELQSPVSVQLLQESFGDMFDHRQALQSVQLMQVDNTGFQEPLVNKTKFSNPPTPVTKVPGNPCTDPDMGAPSAADKRAAKCTIKKSPQCYKLQSRFLAIQGGIADERDKLLSDISQLESDCAETKTTLETSIENDNSLLSSSQTKLAQATEKESTAGEEARQVAKQNEGYNADLVKQMKQCSENYITFETELCALKKIRGELYKLKGTGSAFFQDCEVSKWDPEECTKVCAGGEQKLTRNVLAPAKGGTKCLPLKAVKSCNQHPCPVDCKLHQWGGWSKCSAKCGGGVSQRLRDVKMAMKYEGKPCGATSMAKACNAAACELDCELGEWTKWTKCSKDCDGGTEKRVKFITTPAEGAGTCAGDWDTTRLEYQACNMHRCFLLEGRKVLECNTTMDVTLMIDECPKSGKKGFAGQIDTAKAIVDAFTGPGTTTIPNFAVIKYCGPRTWSGVSKCEGKSKKKVDTEALCRVKVVQHFTEDIKKTKNILTGLEFAKGTKLVALALLAAKAELQLGRKTAQSVVVAFMDGSPLSFRKTGLAARSVRKAARLLWVVVAKFAPMKDIKTWATRRWQENLVQVHDVKKLGAPVATRVIADICPNKIPKLEFGRDAMELGF